MRIRELRLTRYGKFTDRTLQLPARSRDIHLIVGPNEAGKSTARAAIGDWLFGIPARTSYSFLHPNPELRIGGVLERIAGSGHKAVTLSFDRTKGNKNTLRTPEDAPLSEQALQPWLGSLQREAFERMYALSHETLMSGGRDILAASNDVGRMLFQSAAGTSHLNEALRELQGEADELWGPRKSDKRAYYQARDDYENACAELKLATVRPAAWKAQHAALQATRANLASARAQREAQMAQISRLERMRRVAPQLQILDASMAQLNALLQEGDIPLLMDDAAQLLQDAQRTQLIAQQDIERLQGELAQCESAMAQLRLNPELLALGQDIAQLNERRLQYRAHPGDILKRTEEMRAQWLRVQELARGLDWDARSEQAVRERLPATTQRKRLASLLKQHGEIAQGVSTCGTSLWQCQQQLEQAQAALHASAQGAVQPELATQLEQAHKLGDVDLATRQIQTRLDDLARQIEAALAGLGDWRMPPDRLAAMLAPDAAHIQGLQDAQRKAEAEADTLRQTIGTKTQAIAASELALQQLVQRFQPVSREELTAARLARDTVWHAIKAQPDTITAQAAGFEGHLAQADHLADARLERTQHEADRQARLANLEQQQAELAALQAREQQLQAQMQARTAQWQALAQSCGLPTLPLDAASAWLEQRANALALLQEQASLAQQQQGLAQAGEAARQALWALLAPAQGPRPTLAECMRQAQQRIKAADQAQGQRAAIEAQIAQAQASLPALQREADAATKRLQTWQSAWNAALQAAGSAQDTATEQVQAELETMQEIERLLDKMREIRTERIEAMQADLDDLAASAAHLAERAAPDLADQAPQDIALALSTQLAQAEQAQAQHKQLGKQRKDKHTALQAAHARLLAVQADLAPLRAAVGTDDIAALGRAVQRSDQRHALEQQMQAARQRLAEAGDGLSEQELREQAAQVEPDALKAELSQLTQAADETVRAIEALSGQLSSEQAAFDALSGSASAAQAEARRQEALAAMQDAIERYLRLQTALRLLQWSMEKFRETRQGPMLQRASAIFATLTNGSFERLLVDDDNGMPHLLGLRSGGARVPVIGMSDGTRDQLHLALRLAALQLQAAEASPPPFIADDLFINFDDERTQAGLKALGELSTRQQVIFLTHHQHLQALARATLGEQLNVIHL